MTEIFWGFTEKPNFQDGGNIEGELPKKGGLDGLKIEGGGAWKETEGWCFCRGVVIPMHTMAFK